MSFQSESGVFSALNGIGTLARNSVSCTGRSTSNGYEGSHSYRPSAFHCSSEANLITDHIEVEGIHSLHERNWSWRSLRGTFKIHSLGDLYKRYIRRHQNAYFNVYLLLQLFLCVTYIVIVLVFNQDNISITIPDIILNSTLSIFCLIIFLLVSDEQFFRKFPNSKLYISIFLISLIVGLDLSISFHLYAKDRTVKTPSVFQTLIIIYFFLPLENKWIAGIHGIIVTILYILIYGSYFYQTLQNRIASIIADAIFYICGNCIGLYALFMNEIALRRSFLDRRGHIQSTIKKDYETKEEERLLASILPKHVSIQVKQELLAIFHQIDDNKNYHTSNTDHQLIQSNDRVIGTISSDGFHRKPFSQLFVEKHNNVTILYADIVNFTPLTTTLSAEDLVETLNELFGEFDEAAKRHNCLRIKLLGDCYYCVSGLVSTSVPICRGDSDAKNHAKNCVLLGLEMIEIIRKVRENLHVNVQMRIGIHTGNIISGLLGIYKWQYDIWSKDVTIANHMESSGRPGKVHITLQTKTLLGDEFEYQEVTVNDKYLIENNVKTFLIVPTQNNSLGVPQDGLNFDESTKPNGHIFAKRDSEKRGRFSDPKPKTMKRTSRMSEKRPTDVTGENISILIKMLGKVDEQMKEAIDKMPLGKTEKWCGGTNRDVQLQSPFMNFPNWSQELSYLTQTDPLFKFYIASTLFILICQGIMQGVIMPRDHMVLWISFGLGGCYLLLIIPLVWTGWLWDRIMDPHQEMDSIPYPKNPIIRFFYISSNHIAHSWVIRTIIYISVAIVISTFAIIDVIECDNESPEIRYLNQECQHPWYFTYSCTLAILGIFGFFRIHFLVKFMLCVLSISAYATTMVVFRAGVFDSVLVNEDSSPAIPPVFSHIIYLLEVILLLHIMDRQMEYINRLDFTWKLKLTEDHKSASITHGINAVLIHNILPVKIAKMYLDPTRVGQGYSRSYFDVAVMFASIPNYMDSYTETDLTDQGIKCLQLLNEIIVEFDNALFEFDDVEKIKVIGSTYMAACGLEVNERSRSSTSRFTSAELAYMSSRNVKSSATEANMQKRSNSLLQLVKFASAMMSRLKGINKDAFQDFELRVGIDCGPIIAGVIGATHVMYDIWGDTVNMASRMDSTGVNGKIHLTEDSAKLIMAAGVKCAYRDKIRVKGKEHLIPTYFVILNQYSEIQYANSKYYLKSSSSDSEIRTS